MQSNSMIQIENVTKVYSVGKGASVTAVHDVSLQIDRGDFTVIIGRSGSGKTTILNLAAGLTRPTSGRILLDGIDLWTLNDAAQSRVRSQKIGFVFQFPSLLATLTVIENVMLPATFGGNGNRAEAQRHALALLERVGIADKVNAYPRQLSAGQQQRVVIARSLMNNPEVLFADEPTSNLDEKTEMEIVGLFAELHQTMGVTVVLVTHTRQLVSAGMRAIEMADGRIVEATAIPAPGFGAPRFAEYALVRSN